MNIVIYTSNNRGFYNDLNISQLLNNRPDHNYTFVTVQRGNKSNTFISKLKTFIVTLRDGRNLWKRDLRILEKKIRSITKYVNIEDYESHFVDKVNDSKSEALLKSLKPDIILQAGAGILKQNIFSIANKATINVHHGLAPEVRGISSTFWCLYYGLTDLIGVTCHIIDENLDTGDIIKQYQYDYQKGDSFLKIQEEVCVKGASILLESVDMLEQNSEFIKIKEEKTSYYFSSFHYVAYNKLRKNNFLSFKSDEAIHLKSSKKLKSMIQPKPN